MFSSIFLGSRGCDTTTRRKKKNQSNNNISGNINRTNPETETTNDFNLIYSVPFDRDPVVKPARFPLRSDTIYRNREVKAKKKGDMASKVSNFSDLIQRVAASCLHVGGNRVEEVFEYETDEHEDLEEEAEVEDEEEEEGMEEKKGRVKGWDQQRSEMVPIEKVMEMEMIINEVFDSISTMKRAYVSLQEAHCPWDLERMRVADVAVVGEMRRLGALKETFRRHVSVGVCGGGKGRRRGGGGVELLREMVVPYEAAVEELKRVVKAREVEVENLKEKLRRVTSLTNGGGKKAKSQSKRKVSCSYAAQVAIAPGPELFETTMSQVKEILKAFTSLLLSLMRAASWDIAAAVRSIEAAAATIDNIATATTAIPSTVATHHAKYAMESYISRKIFQGFDHETFYMDGNLSSLVNPDQFRSDCFTQYRDMKAMDPVEVLGILPTCHFGKFCLKKYLAIVHPKMEESLFGNLEQRQQVVDGQHPRSEFYSEFLGLAKAIWLLHLLAFSLDPAPSQFEASRGAEFHPQYMESVVKHSGSRIPGGQIVGFPVSPGFKLGNGSVIKARVYLVSRT